MAGKVIILSAPSGSGKSTIISQIMKDKSLRLEFSISATNRSPRGGETDGVSYHFISTEAFRKAIADDALIEYEEVYPGRYYGTLKSEVDRIQGNGNNIVLDIDVKGAVNVMKQFKGNVLSLFIQPPSLQALRERLTGRGTESEEAIEQRLGKAEYELSFASEFDHVVINDDLATAVSEVHKLISDFVNE